MQIISKKIKDRQALRLIRIILANHQTRQPGRGMPLGNLTSQFFANIYLNNLDQFIKNKLKAKYYVRYVDDFVIIGSRKEILEHQEELINEFLNQNLGLELHAEKSKIHKPNSGINFLGFRTYQRHMLLKKSNLRKFRKKLENKSCEYQAGKITYDKVYDFLEGWSAYARHANTHKLHIKLLLLAEKTFNGAMSGKEIDRHAKDRKASPISA